MKFLLRLFRVVRGLAFGILILLTSLFGNYIICLGVPLVLLKKHRAWRFFMDRAISYWMNVPMGFLEFIFGLRVRVSGDEIDPTAPALIIMNHRTRLDWMYFWSALYQMNPWLITTNKITLKAQLKSLPGAGFGMSAASFIFLQRDIEKDRKEFDTAIDYYKSMGFNYQLLLFPEGTDKSPWTTTKSEEYAKKHNLPRLQHLLYPRVAGFHHLLSNMRKANYISSVYDITVGYPYNLVQSEVDLVVKGACPRDVHFHVNRIDVNTIPTAEAEVSEWLNKLWFEKEQRLKQFYSEPKSCDRRFPIEKGQQVWRNTKEPFRKRAVKVFSFCLWCSVICICLYHITFLISFQLGMLYKIIVVLWLTYVYGGVDKFVIFKWRKDHQKISVA